MSSTGGIGARSAPRSVGAPVGGGLAGEMVAAAFRLAQARTAVSLAALVALVLSLEAGESPARLAVLGTAGLVLLSLVLFRDVGARVSFVAGNLLLLALLVWAASETLRLDIVLLGNTATAALGERSIVTGVPAGKSGRGALWIGSDGPQLPEEAGWSERAVQSAARTVGRSAAAGVERLEVFDPAGQSLAGPYTFWASDRADGAPAPGDAQSEVDVLGSYRRFGSPTWSDVQVRLNLRNGGPPVILLLRLDDGLNGLAVQAWPDRRELTIHPMRGGVLEPPLAGGYQTLLKPSHAMWQSLLRELLRAWLVGLALVSLGCVLAPVARLLPRADDWRAPAGVGLAMAGLIGIFGLAITAWIASDVLEGIPHVQDSVAYLFQAKTFALGRLAVPLPAIPQAFEHEFVLMWNGAWFSKYPPGHPALLALGVLAGVPWLVSPVAAGITIVLTYTLGRSLFSGGIGLLAALLLMVSPFFLFMSGSMMSHPTGLMLTTLGLLLVSRTARSGGFWLPLLAGLSLGSLVASRPLTGLAVSLAAFGWLAVERFRQGESIETLIWCGLGWSWPVLALLAYNRALTGNPLLHPFELWWPFDRVGFGPEVGLHGGHDLARGLWNLWVNLSVLEAHLFGWPLYLTLAFAFLPFALGRARSGDWLCALVSVAVGTAHVFYWADGVMYGPRYLYEAASSLALMTARGAMVAAEGASGLTPGALRRPAGASTGSLFLLLLGGLALGNLTSYLPAQIERHRGYNFTDGARQKLVRSAGLSQALVFVPTSQPNAWWEYGSVFSANDPLLEGEVIYARDLGPRENQRTMAAFPHRRAYRLADGKLSPLTREP